MEGKSSRNRWRLWPPREAICLRDALPPWGASDTAADEPSRTTPRRGTTRGAFEHGTRPPSPRMHTELMVLSRTFLLPTACGLLSSHLLWAQASRTTSGDSTLLASLDATIERAVVQGDTAALDTLYATDFQFTHSTGMVDGRAEWLRRAVMRPPPFRSRTADSVAVELHGSMALTSGRLAVVPRSAPGYIVRYVRLYAKQGARWELKSHRSVELRAQTARRRGS